MSSKRVYEKRSRAEEVKVTAKVWDQLVSQPCGFCEEEPERGGDGDDGADWGEQAGWEQYEKRVVLRTSSVHTDIYGSYDTESKQWDICPDCFDKHVRPVLPEPYSIDNSRS